MQESSPIGAITSGAIKVSASDRVRLSKYCAFFEISLPHLLGEELPQIKQARALVGAFLNTTTKPETGIEKSRQNIEQFKTDKVTWLKVIVRNTTVMNRKPSSIGQKVQDFAAALAEDGLTVDEVIQLFIRTPSLINQDLTVAQSVIADIVAEYHVAGVTRRKLVNAFAKQPTYFAASTKILIPKSEAIRAAEAEGYLRYPARPNGTYGDLGDFVVQQAAALTVSLENLNRSLGLCRQKYEYTGKPHKKIPLDQKAQQAIIRSIDELKEAVPSKNRARWRVMPRKAGKTYGACWRMTPAMRCW